MHGMDGHRDFYTRGPVPILRHLCCQKFESGTLHYQNNSNGSVLMFSEFQFGHNLITEDNASIEGSE